MDRRIEYAHTGYADPASDENGLTALIEKRISSSTVPQGAAELLQALRNIFIEQINWAVNNLPLFHTYRACTPDPVTVDEYCECLDAARSQFFSQASLPGRSDRYGTGDLARHAPFRRRDQALVSQYGPLGTGLDTQAAILVHSLNRSEPKPALTEQSVFYAQNVFDRSDERLGEPSLASCFQWSDADDDRRRICRRPDGAVDVNREHWAGRLHTFWENRPSYITAPHTFPINQSGTISTQASDWFDFRHLSPAIRDWLELEAAAAIFRFHNAGSFFGHESFPVLQSPALEFFADTESDSAPILQAAPGYAFVAIEWREPLMSALICTLFTEYLLHRRHEPSEIYPQEFRPIYSPSRSGPDDLSSGYVIALLESSHKPSEAGGLANYLDSLPPATLKKIGMETMESFRLLEHSDAYLKRLEPLLRNRPERLVTRLQEPSDLIYWSVLARTFRPFMTNAEFPFASVPSFGRKQGIAAPTQDYPAFFRSANPDELMIETAAAHFESKAETAYAEVASPALRKHSKEFGWSFINQQDRSDYSYFFSTGRLDSFGDLRTAAAREGKKSVIAKLPWTNAVSSTGRLGRPIRYYEWIDADTRLLASDVATSSAFTLLAAGLEVSLMTRGQIVLHIPVGQVDDVSKRAEDLIRQAITTVLGSAFPSEKPPIDVFEYFVNDGTVCSISETWPIRNPEPDIEEPDEINAVQAVQPLVSPDVLEDHSPSDVLRKPPSKKKHFRKRKNSKKRR